MCLNSNVDCSVYSRRDHAQDEIISNLILPVSLRTSFPRPDFHGLTLLIRTTHHGRVWSWTFLVSSYIYIYIVANIANDKEGLWFCCHLLLLIDKKIFNKKKPIESKSKIDDKVVSIVQRYLNLFHFYSSLVLEKLLGPLKIVEVVLFR